MVPPTPPTMTVHPSRDLARSEGDDDTADSSSEEDSEEDSDMVFTLPNMILRVASLVGSWARGSWGRGIISSYRHRNRIVGIVGRAWHVHTCTRTK